MAGIQWKTFVSSRMILLAVVLVILAVVWFLLKPISSQQEIRHVILISIDTCRADYLSCYGCPGETTPNIDAVAADGFLFKNAIAPVPVTLPSHSSMLTGTIPPYHGVHDNHDYKLGGSNVTLAEILGENGFATGAVISAFMLDSQFGLNQGFDTYNDRFDEALNSIGIEERNGEETSRYAIEWLEKNKDKKAFLFLHYYDPHASYAPPEPFASRFAMNPYAGEIAYTDYCIGKVIDKLKDLDLYDSSLIIITADHGEMLGEHGETTHGYFIYQSAIKVPLIIKLPGRNKPEKIEHYAGLIDIVPTICNMLKIPVPEHVQGKDLSPFFHKDQAVKKDRFLYSECLVPTRYKANSLLAVVSEKWKYIQTTEPELYDLTMDRHEKNNLAKQQPHQARILQDKLKQILEQTVINSGSDSKLELDQAGRERLESLGYVSSGKIEQDYEFDQTKEDPKQLIGFHNLFAKLSLLIFKQQHEEAIKLCKQLAVQRPNYSPLYIKMGEIAIDTENLEDAVTYFEKALSFDTNDPEIYEYLGKTKALQGKKEEAIRYCNKALELKPDQPRILYNLASIYFDRGNTSEAIAMWERTLELDPRHLKAHCKLARTLVGQGRISEAIEYYRAAIKLEDKVTIDTHNDLAWLLATNKQVKLASPDEAVNIAKNICEITNYENPNLLDTLAAAYAAVGRFADAISTAEKALELTRSLNDIELAKQLSGRLQLYKISKPYYESAAR